MSGEVKWTLGEERDFVDPQTGEVIKEMPLLYPDAGRTPRAAGLGFVVLNMDAVAVAAHHLGGTGLLVLMEAARQWRLGNGSVSLTTAFCERLGITRQGARTAARELGALAAATGWVKVRQIGNRAVEVSVTTEGLARIWHK